MRSFGRRLCALTRPRQSAVRGGSARAPVVPLWEAAISVEEEAALVAQADGWLARRRYEPGHFDGVITQYRELQQPLRRFSCGNQRVIERLLALALPAHTDVLPVHILDLLPEGEIGTHVDHQEYSGAHIVGLSLLSHAVMTLKREECGSRCELLLPRRSLYVLSGAARYEWAHEVAAQPVFEGVPMPAKQRRLSLLFRDRAAAVKQEEAIEHRRDERKSQAQDANKDTGNDGNQAFNDAANVYERPRPLMTRRDLTSEA